MNMRLKTDCKTDCNASRKPLSPLKMVGAIGFEPSPLKRFQILAGLGWHPKAATEAKGTFIGHGLDTQD